MALPSRAHFPVPSPPPHAVFRTVCPRGGWEETAHARGLFARQWCASTLWGGGAGYRELRLPPHQIVTRATCCRNGEKSLVGRKKGESRKCALLFRGPNACYSPGKGEQILFAGGCASVYYVGAETGALLCIRGGCDQNILIATLGCFLIKPFRKSATTFVKQCSFIAT